MGPASKTRHRRIATRPYQDRYFDMVEAANGFSRKVLPSTS